MGTFISGEREEKFECEEDDEEIMEVHHEEDIFDEDEQEENGSDFGNSKITLFTHEEEGNTSRI